MEIGAASVMKMMCCGVKNIATSGVHKRRNIFVLVSAVVLP
jgi:hypothetical protein